MLKLAWRPRAQLDRKSIAIFIGAERKAPDAALRTIQAIDAAIERVREFPESGRRYAAEGLDAEYRTIISGSYTVFYTYDADTLTVQRILHQRQNLDIYTLVDFSD